MAIDDFDDDIQLIKFRLNIGGKECSSLADLQKHFRFAEVDNYWSNGKLEEWCRDLEKPIACPSRDYRKNELERCRVLCDTFFSKKFDGAGTLLNFLKKRNIPHDEMTYLAIAQEQGTSVWKVLSNEDIRKIENLPETKREGFERLSGASLSLNNFDKNKFKKSCDSKTYQEAMAFFAPGSISWNLPAGLFGIFERTFSGKEKAAMLSLLENCSNKTNYQYNGANLVLRYAAAVKENNIPEVERLKKRYKSDPAYNSDPNYHLPVGNFDKYFCRAILRIMLFGK